MNSPVLEDAASEVEEKLEMAMHSRLSGRVRDLRIIVRDEGVILRGCAATYHGKQLAQHAVMEMTDRPILANEIEVR
jgi:hypothetical protein